MVTLTPAFSLSSFPEILLNGKAHGFIIQLPMFADAFH